MKKTTLLILLISVFKLSAQTFTSNQTPVGMEHNLLFNATTRFNVTQTGTANLGLNALFDGKFVPSYTSIAPTPLNPTIILIEELPNIHIQLGGWIGWSTRYWEANRFKIEGYDVYQSANTWKTIADYSNQDYSGGRKFIQKIPRSGSYTKLRFTFYSATGSSGRLGVSELFFIHPEAISPYEGLLSSTTSNQWKNNNSDLYYSNGNIGIGTSSPVAGLEIKHDEGIKVQSSASGGYRGTIKMVDGLTNTTSRDDMLFSTHGGFIFKMDENGNGISNVQGFNVYNRSNNSVFTIKESDGNIGIGTTTPDTKLTVKGIIHSEEVKVDLSVPGPDYVFNSDYELTPLEELQQYITTNKHLPNIQSAKEMEANGIELGIMNMKLLEKIEELTLYTIQQEKQLKSQAETNKDFKDRLLRLEQLLLKTSQKN